jgi:hypothetical protein
MVKATPLPEPVAVLLDVPSDPVEVERARARRERFDRNWAWFQSQVVELGKKLFGRYVCVAGQQAFVAETASEAVAAAAATHPDDDGRFVYFFPTHRLPRIHAHSG